jgi:asparagine synthase (glutamine-hydrolysing)
VTFNGEIYNYRTLRTELQQKGWTFASESDTEVLLKAYGEWGSECVHHLNGMFAFAIWDERTQTLFAARDRLGEKPFKYYADNETFIFASELKAILEDPRVPRSADWQAIDIALSFRYVPAPRTGFDQIHKLPAGHTLTWHDGQVAIQKYWDAESTSHGEPSPHQPAGDLWNMFRDAVQLRMVSDVPLGAFLSGGIDSTSVVAAMAEVTDQPIETFAISLGGESEDIRYARTAAAFFRTNHHEIQLTDIDYPGTLRRLVAHYDEPFFDQSALPSLLVNERVKEFVTVVLSGDGGDELFGGYDAYAFAVQLAKYQRLPRIVRAGAGMLAQVSNASAYRLEIMNQPFAEAYTEYFSLWKTALPRSKRYVTKADLYRPELAVNIQAAASAAMMRQWLHSPVRDTANQAMLADIRGRLPDGYLAKVDFASMASAVEVRAPFLDFELVAASRSISGQAKLRHGPKTVWKQVVQAKIPPSIIQRPKAGFGIPLHTILLTDMRTFVTDTLFDPSARIAAYVSPTTVKRLWQDHEQKKADYSNHIWSLLMLELWMQQYLK